MRKWWLKIAKAILSWFGRAATDALVPGLPAIRHAGPAPKKPRPPHRAHQGKQEIARRRRQMIRLGVIPYDRMTDAEREAEFGLGEE